MIMRLPTPEQVASAKARLAELTNRRLIQYTDARNTALRLLKAEEPDVAGAIAVLEGTKVAT